MGDPQVTTGFNTTSHSLMTWMIVVPPWQNGNLMKPPYVSLKTIQLRDQTAHHPTWPPNLSRRTQRRRRRERCTAAERCLRALRGEDFVYEPSKHGDFTGKNGGIHDIYRWWMIAISWCIISKWILWFMVDIYIYISFISGYFLNYNCYNWGDSPGPR